MKKYELTPELLTGHPQIDAQHKELFDAINNLMDACNSGKGRDSIESTISFLQKYIIKHFNDEEKLQQSVNYPAYKAHKQAHEGFKKLSQSVGDALLKNGADFNSLAELNRAVFALISHVKNDDKKVAAYIQSQA